MRTNIEIDDALLRRVMAATSAETKKNAIETAMRLTVQLKGQEGLRRLRGVGWDGDLQAMRESRFLNKDGFFEQDSGMDTPNGIKAGRNNQKPADKASIR